MSSVPLARRLKQHRMTLVRRRSCCSKACASTRQRRTYRRRIAARHNGMSAEITSHSGSRPWSDCRHQHDGTSRPGTCIEPVTIAVGHDVGPACRARVLPAGSPCGRRKGHGVVRRQESFYCNGVSNGLGTEHDTDRRSSARSSGWPCAFARAWPRPLQRDTSRVQRRPRSRRYRCTYVKNSSTVGIETPSDREIGAHESRARPHQTHRVVTSNRPAGIRLGNRGRAYLDARAAHKRERIERRELSEWGT